MDHIDRAAARFGGPECLDDPTILAPIVAYVGEVMRDATSGHWELRPWLGPARRACPRLKKWDDLQIL
jgi:hypothetical protein